MFFPLEPVPGIDRTGTEYQTGKPVLKWWDQNLTRFIGRMVGPIGGWVLRTATTVSGKARAIMPWRDLSGTRRIGIGTHTKLYSQSEAGVVTDITPSAFVAGEADETANLGFGGGSFGTGLYGVARPDVSATIPALVWDLDVWFGDLVGCARSDGRLVQWDLNTANDAVAITGAPTDCLGTLVSDDGFQFAFGAGGIGNHHQWCNQDDNTDWTPSALNQAGDVDLVTAGEFRKAIKVGRPILVFNDTDVHIGNYRGLPNVYVFEKLKDGAGAISSGAPIAMGQQAAWWSDAGFFLYSGGVNQIPCPLWDFLKSDVNFGQKSKITGWNNLKNGELWWHYPSGDGMNVDSVVTVNLQTGVWGKHRLARLCGAGPGIFTNPILISSDGETYEHETGYDYDDDEPYCETAPFELGNGDRVQNCIGIVPDEQVAGEVSATFYGRDYPDAEEVTLDSATFTTAGYSDLRFSARQARMRITGAANADWRFGTARLDLKAGGKR